MGYHIENITMENVAQNVIISGSSERIRKVQDFLEESEVISDSRGFLLITGYYCGVRVSACSVGMGGPSLAIAVEELVKFGAKVIIRVGSCGVIQSWGKPGDIFISTGSVRHDGTSQKYLPLEFPAIPDFSLTCKLIEAAQKEKTPYNVGIGSCNDVYYKPKRSVRDQEMRELMEKANVLYGEMECATLFAVGLYHNIQTAAILVSDSSLEKKKDAEQKSLFLFSESTAIGIALNALVENVRIKDSKCLM